MLSHLKKRKSIESILNRIKNKKHSESEDDSDSESEGERRKRLLCEEVGNTAYVNNLKHVCNLFKKYKTLTKLEIKEIVIEDKWFFTIKNLLDKEMEKISQNLSRRIIELVERYEITLPSLIKETETYSYKIHNHLKKMGFQW